jgi:Na+/proline symporter
VTAFQDETVIPLMLDLIIVFTFIGYSVINGFGNRTKASRSLEEYFLAGRSSRGWRAGVSLAATQFAADTPLLATGLIATGGAFMLWRLWIYGLGFLMIGFLLGRAWRHAHVITDAELTEIRYSGRGVLALRGLKAIYYGTVMNCIIMAMVLVAATRMSELFLPWNEWLPTDLYIAVYDAVASTGIPLASGTTGLETYVATSNNLISILAIVAFTALYSTTGGLRAVIATDTVQFSRSARILEANRKKTRYGPPTPHQSAKKRPIPDLHDEFDRLPYAHRLRKAGITQTGRFIQPHLDLSGTRDYEHESLVA